MAYWHSLWMTPALAPEIENELNIERLTTVARHQPIAAAAHALVSLALAAAIHTPVRPPALYALPLFQIVAALQFSAWWQHRHQARPAHVSNKTISRIILWTVMLGLMWGAFTAHLLMTATGRDCALMTMAIVGMAAGGVGMLTSIPAAAAAFLVFSMLPTAAVAFIMGDRGDAVFGIFLVICCLFLAMSARHNYLAFLDNLYMRLRMAKLAQEADSANQTKSRFLANMGHELRTPLNAVIGFAEMIGGEMKGAIGNRDYVEFADAIVQSARHLVTVIDDILDLSKFESGASSPCDSEIPVAILTNHVLTAIQPVCAKARVKLVSHIAPGLPIIRVDTNRLHHVLINLISNAIRFSVPGGEVRLEVLQAQPSGNGAPAGVMFRVTDHGPGIPSAELSDILKPFVWSREAERHQTPGTGLKLPLADQIVRAHGGTLHIASIEGQGTIVTITLPPERTVGYQSSESTGGIHFTALGTAPQE